MLASFALKEVSAVQKDFSPPPQHTHTSVVVVDLLVNLDCTYLASRVSAPKSSLPKRSGKPSYTQARLFKFSFMICWEQF